MSKENSFLSIVKKSFVKRMSQNFNNSQFSNFFEPFGQQQYLQPPQQFQLLWWLQS